MLQDKSCRAERCRIGSGLRNVDIDVVDTAGEGSTVEPLLHDAAVNRSSRGKAGAAQVDLIEIKNVAQCHDR